MSAIFKTCLIQLLYGVKDSLLGVALVPFIDREIEKKREESWKRLQESLAARERSVASQRRWMNRIEYEKHALKDLPRLRSRLVLAVSFGMVIWMILNLFSIYLMPLLRGGFSMLFELFPHDETNLDDMWFYFESFSYFFFNAFLILPLTIINKLAAGIWLLEIAKLLYRHFYGQTKSFPSFSVAVADFLYSIPISVLFSLQGNAFNYLIIQSIGLHHLLYAFHVCLLYSLYAFEYKWYYMGIDLRIRLQLVEQNWPYFFGFGFPLYLATHLVPSMYSGYTYSSLFPFMVISATRASAPRSDIDIKLPLFKASAWLCSALFTSSFRKRNVT